MKRPERTLKIWKMLSSGRSVSLATFLDRLDVSLATFKRDLSAMRSEMNVQVVWLKAENAYALDRTTQPPDDSTNLLGTWFDRDELLALIAIQQLLDQVEPKLLKDVMQPLRQRTAALLKGSGVAGEHLRQALARIRVLPMQRRPVDDALFERIVSALVTRCQLQVESIDRQTRLPTPRAISPQRVISYRDNWYLDAWCHLRGALRTFSLDTLQNVRVTKAACKDIDAAALDEHFTHSYGIFSGAATHTATLSFSPRVSGWIEREQWHPEQTTKVLPTGEIELTVPYANATELVRDILKWGPDVEVVAPLSLRNQVGDAARATADQYL